MKIFRLKISILAILAFALTSLKSYSQQGTVDINQDKKITDLLDAKKKMNADDTNSDRYKIQIYSGADRAPAYAIKKDFNESFSNWSSIVMFEPPNFKTWIGNFRTRLEADRALRKVKKKFSNAFIFKPKKKAND